MSEKSYDRRSLKSLFSNGERPNAQNFGSLIDSMVNKVDDGISKTPKEGLILAPGGSSTEKVLSFKNKIQDDVAKWSFELQQEKNQGLAVVQPISEDESKTRLFFSKSGTIGVHTETPKTDLDVRGITGLESRIGTYKMGSVKADRIWHDITPSLNGSNAFEIMAYVGKEKHGRYALVHAHALSTFGGSRGRIRKTQATYKWWCWDRITFRWVGTTYDYKLQIRTRSNYGDGIKIKYHITKLWDSDILECISQNS